MSSWCRKVILRQFRERVILRRHWTEFFLRWRGLPLPERIRKRAVLRHGTGKCRGAALFGKMEVDFSPRGIDLEGFPYATWRKISRAVLKEEDRDLFFEGDPQGDLILREAIREYLHAARGVNCDASQIIIGAGNEYLLMLLSQLLGKDAVIAMEDPTYRQAYRVLSGVGHKVPPVGIDKNGFCKGA